jgi:hypothetical protein
MELTGACRCYAGLIVNNLALLKSVITQPLKARVWDFCTHFRAAGRGGLSWILKYLGD